MEATEAPPPPPQRVQYNNWRQLEVPERDAFTPALPVSVIVSCHAQPEELARTLAALEGQTYPRELIEVVVVDDGSPAPLECPESTPLDVKVVRQDQGFRLAAARNAGARAAAHDVLVFLDSDTMPEAEFVAAHARWHHVVPDALTLGIHAHAPVDGVDPDMIRNRSGTLAELLSGRRVDLEVLRWIAAVLKRTDDLTAKSDDLLELVTGGNLGVRRAFFELVGGFDETFTQWGAEGTEFGWRAYVRGGLLVPVREAFSWHQGSWEDDRAEQAQLRHLQQAKIAHLIAHPSRRTGLAGRTFKVPQYVVTIQGGNLRAQRLLKAVERVLSGSMHDLVVRLEQPRDDADREWLEHQLGPDPRVQMAPERTVLEAFPASPFHIILPAWVNLHEDVVRRLHDGLGSAVMGRAELPHNSFASITRAWALFRAQRTPWEVADFGDVVEIPAEPLLQPGSGPARTAPDSPSGVEDLAPGAVVTEPPSASESPGVEIAALGARSQAVFQASEQVRLTADQQQADVVLADTPAEAADAPAPVVVLAEAPPLLSTPAFDPLRHNPVDWPYDHDGTVGALGPLDQLPANCGADRIVPADDPAALKALHHLEDTAAFHTDPVARAGELVRLAAMGVVVHLADGDEQLAPYLGAKLFELMTGEVRDLDLARREMVSIRMRREALREHSLRSRARQLCAHAAIEPPPLPLVSVLLVTKRPHLLQHALAAVARQTYPRLELVLGLHGDGFADVEQDLAALPVPATVVRIDPEEPLGTALNLAAAEATGGLLTKMDDDDAYGREHVWDLVLAQNYAQAQCVSKARQYYFLANSNATIYRNRGQLEQRGERGHGSSMLVTREIFFQVGGFPPLRTNEDWRLMESISEQGGQLYLTHGAGLTAVRHGRDHTWKVDEELFLKQAHALCFGWDPEQFCIEDMVASYLPANVADAARRLARRKGPRKFLAMAAAGTPLSPLQRVQYNDWRQLRVPAPDAFIPVLPVSVIVSYYAQPEELARTLAALEGQTYPRELIEVVVVDDGSPAPLECPESTPLNVKVVRQEDLGFRLAASRNAGVRAAAHDVLVFMDSDTMPEAEFVAAHARWHHVAPDALTLGIHAHVPVDGVELDMIRNRSGTLEDLIRGRRVDLEIPRWIARTLNRTDNLTANPERIFELVTGGNLGVRRAFFDRVGGFDETFTQWGGEDTEFGWRAYVRGGLLVPVREAFSWHQGSWDDDRPEKEQTRHLQQAKIAHLIAHPSGRTGLAGRTFKVPQYVVTIRGGNMRAQRLLEAVECVLSGSMHDLVVRVEQPRDDADREWLERQLGPDPRVQVAPERTALEAFPASPFHIILPAWVNLHEDVVRRLRDGLGSAVMGRAELPLNSFASITRAWAMFRAKRTPWEVADFGDVVEIPGEQLLQPGSEPARLTPDSPSGVEDVTPGAPLAEPPSASESLGVEIAVLGARSQAVFQASEQVRLTADQQQADVVLADTPAEAADAPAPVVVLAEAPPLLSTPAFDPLRHNPVDWPYDHDGTVGALGPLDQLPANCGADHIVSADDPAALKALHHLEDTAAFHTDPVARAGELVRLAAMGVVVHLADGDEQLAPYLGAKLFELMTGEVRGLDVARREMVSIRMRREALREHSLRSRARQLCAHAAIEPPPLPLVSVLLVTRRPHLLQHALAAVARQTYPRLELVLGLHGDGFADVERDLAALPVPATVVRIDPGEPLGTALNLAAAEATGGLLAKMDDDDAYGREHVWDLVLAQNYAQAECVSKAGQFFFLANANATIYRFRGLLEQRDERGHGGSMLVTREIFFQVGGFPPLRTNEDWRLMGSIRDQGGRLYLTHSAGLTAVRHGRDHTWKVDEELFLKQAHALCFGWDPERFCIEDMAASYLFSRGGGPRRAIGTDQMAGLAEARSWLRLPSSARPGSVFQILGGWSRKFLGRAATGTSHPPPQRVQYNDWRQLKVPGRYAFTPVLPVSVIVSCHAQPEELARTLAALEGQTYPRELIEVVVVDDGSPAPLACPESTPLNVRVVRQGDQGFRLAAARNAGVRAAAHDVLVFLDSDTMPEAEFIAAHARWHHVVPDALTLGLHAHVPVDGVDPDLIRNRSGTLEDLFKGRRVDLEVLRWMAAVLKRTDDLTAKSDDSFRIVTGGNLGVRRAFFDLVGGFDETFTQWGAEGTEFGWRAYVRGGLLVPVGEAFSWHQGSWEDGRPEKEQLRHLQQPNIAQLIAHPSCRTGLAGRTFKVPQNVVTILGGNLRAGRLLEAVERVLSGSIHDLVVRLEFSERHPGREWLNRTLGPDPRVQVAPERTVLEAFPASPFHIILPAWVNLHEDVVRRLHDGLGSAVMGRAELPHNSFASITRAWALFRAQRTPWEVADFGDVVEIPAEPLLQPGSGPARTAPDSPSGVEDLAPGAVVTEPPSASESPGVEIAALGARSQAVFQASEQVRLTANQQQADVVLADTPAEAADAPAPVVVLAEAPPLLSTPAFDPLRHNPVDWPYDHDGTVGALGPLDQLPANCGADHVVPANNPAALKALHHLEDTAAFHTDPVARAGELVRLAAMGVVVHLADGDEQLAPYLGAELFELMTGEVRGLDVARREMRSIRMRREAHREHSLRSRARQLCTHAAIEPPPLPLVSVLLVTRRPHLLQHALAAVARQTYPRLELVLGLHGDGFADVERDLAALPVPAAVVRIDPEEPLGTALNLAAAEAAGGLLTKMDDDDAYGREHVWDLVLAQNYTQAQCVSKAAEHYYLSELNTTVHRWRGKSEKRDLMGGGSSMLMEREIFFQVGGFPPLHSGEDTRLMESIRDQKGQLYRTHGGGYTVFRHGAGHAWGVDDGWVWEKADAMGLGWDPEQFCIEDMIASYLPAAAANSARQSVHTKWFDWLK